MPTLHDRASRILRLADAITEDIRRRRLRPGDPYQNTHETAEMLGVSTTAANRAMQVLVKRRLLERRQRKGTFIAQPPTDSSATPLRRVHLLVQENYLRTEGLLSDGVVVGMHEALPAAQLQFNFMPPENEGRFVEELISEAMRSGRGEGFVLVRASLQVQRLFAGSGLPVVVHGSLHPSIERLDWIDRDHVQAGRLIAEHLLRQNITRMLVLMRDRMFQGDHQLLDTLFQTVGAAGLGSQAITLRCLPSDQQAIVAATRDWLDGGSSTELAGIICRSEPLAQGAAAAALTPRKRNRARIVLSDYYRRGSEQPPVWPHLKPTLSPEEIGTRIGRMLANQARQLMSAKAARRVLQKPSFEIIPVELEITS